MYADVGRRGADHGAAADVPERQIQGLEAVSKGRNSSIERIIRSDKRKIRRFTGGKSRVFFQRKKL